MPRSTKGATCTGAQACVRAQAAKDRFAVAEGDLVTLLNVWRGWQEDGGSRHWCAWLHSA